jgi:hypothetical protein
VPIIIQYLYSSVIKDSLREEKLDHIKTFITYMTLIPVPKILDTNTKSPAPQYSQESKID